MPTEGLVSILTKEPAGLSIGKVVLTGGEEMLGVLAEPFLTEVRIRVFAQGGSCHSRHSCKDPSGSRGGKKSITKVHQFCESWPQPLSRSIKRDLQSFSGQSPSCEAFPARSCRRRLSISVTSSDQADTTCLDPFGPFKKIQNRQRTLTHENEPICV